MTYEFLSSLEIFQEPGANYSKILTFQLFNNDHSLMDAQLCSYFKFPWAEDADFYIYPGHIRMASDHGYDEQRWWRSISEEGKYDPQTSKSASMIHPAMRYFNRILTYALCSKDSLGAISREELCWLWIADQNDFEIESVDFTEHLITRFLDIRDGVCLSGCIQLGGMISILALCINDDYKTLLDELPPIINPREKSPSHFLNISALLNQKFLDRTRKDDVFIWKVSRFKEWFLIPCKEATTRHEERDSLS